MDTFFYISYFILWIVVIVQSLLVFNYMKFVNEFISKMTQFNKFSNDQGMGRERGMSAPHFKVKDQFKNVFKVEPNQGERKILVFISETCPTCKRVISSIHDNHQLDVNTLLFITNGPIEEKYLGILNNHQIRYTISPELFHKYSIQTAPAVIMINQEGRIIEDFIIDSFADLSNAAKMTA
jgi:thioredoxin-related protein